MEDDRRAAAGDRLRHRHRRLGPHPVGPDGRRVLALRAPRAAARGRPQLRARRGADAARTSRSWRASPATPSSACYPNAGLPNPMSETGFDETPDVTVGPARGVRASRLPQHRRRLLRHHARAHRADRRARRPLRAARAEVPRAGGGRMMVAPMRLSGLEPVTIGDDSLFVNVGERTNVTGSKAFARLILERQVRGGARRSRASRSRTARRSSTSTWTRRCSTRRRRWCAS